ncbi:acyl-CoA dehydrogenase family protein [Arhodomonas sp. KWT2]|uniref:acyl-CoA dehydrogenase family protein n=1 Tax=unclassified Arhodomonas TaxID=2621637 RepID=UPI0013D7877D|nr:acyl-CoA dehydrogenase family protein [Arhodomonas sp. KWT]
MRFHRPRTRLGTHEVDNQPFPPDDYDAWATDRPLREQVTRLAPEWTASWLAALGEETGRGHWFEQAQQAERHPPELVAFDTGGRRVDEVHYHPAYHALMALAIGHDLHGVAWRRNAAGGHIAHVAGLYLFTQPEQGVCCPVTMTHAAVPALLAEPAVADDWLPWLMSTRYDARSLPAGEKAGATFGMAMTEKQGGSDVRANTTRAVAAGGDGEYVLTGHKWFCSAPMSDAFLTLAQADEGLTCFLVPRWRPDGARNGIRLQRLKDKCGNRSNASAEIEYDDAWARRVGPPGRGVRTIIEMVQQTRLDAATAPVGMMRQALVQAWHFCRARRAFGATLAEQPLMREVLADLALEVEAGLTMVLRLAAAFEAPADAAGERRLARLGTAAAKYWTNKRAPAVIAEAMECLGGNGYVETGPLARLYREAPVNGIWEGAGNVICLDVRRALVDDPEVEAAFLAELALARGADSRLDAAIEALPGELASVREDPAAARRATGALALALQASLLVRHAPAPVAEAFCASRLGGGGGYTLGCLPAGVDRDAILARIWPE